MDQAQRRQFVRDHRTCVFGYARKDHGPAMTVVYYVMDGDDMLISTMAAREKAKAVARGGKVSLCMCRATSPHPGGINLGLGDGSVRFLSAGVTGPTWFAACTPAGGETLGSDWN